MTLKEEIEAKIAAHQAEIDSLKAHLAAGGAWLEQEASSVGAWLEALIAKVRAKL